MLVVRNLLWTSNVRLEVPASVLYTKFLFFYSNYLETLKVLEFELVIYFLLWADSQLHTKINTVFYSLTWQIFF